MAYCGFSMGGGRTQALSWTASSMWRENCHESIISVDLCSEVNIYNGDDGKCSYIVNQNDRLSFTCLRLPHH